MYTQTNVGLLCCVGSVSNVAVPLDRAATQIGDDDYKHTIMIVLLMVKRDTL